MTLLKSDGVTVLCGVVVVTVVAIGHHGADSYMLGNDPTRRAEYLDPQGKYLLEWEPLWSQRRIVFNVTVQTHGYVAFGLANNANDGISGGMDLIIAGVFQQDMGYFMDYHVSGGGYPRVDPSQDYTLHGAWESNTHTFISFSRHMDTCDGDDYPITDNKVSVIWAYGEKDDHENGWEQRKKGSYDVYLLDQDFSPKIERRGFYQAPEVVTEQELGTWTLSKRMRIPSNETSYFCSIHRGPRLPSKHHVVGLDVHFPDQESKQHVHHLLIYKCNTPQGISPGIFEPFVGDQNQVCYMIHQPPTNGPMPTHFCTELYLGWAVGGRPFFMPPHVGLPLATTPNEYYMVQVHYDNPQHSPNLVIDLRMHFFYTSQLRAHEGGFMGIGHDIPGLSPSLLIPPNARNHRVFGHCSAACTERMFPADNGIKIYAAILHSHNSGRRMRIRHFSSKDPYYEQPWILYDDNYSNRYQQFRHLHQERRIRPGDQLTMECTYDSTWSNGSSVVGGYATKQEMCLTFIAYYNRVWDYNLCRSEIVSEEYRQHLLGVSNITWIENQLDYVATDNGMLAGLTMQELSDNYVNWDRNQRQELQRFHETSSHVGKCSRELYSRTPTALLALMRRGMGTSSLTGQVPTNVDTPDDYSGPVGYPHRVRPYSPYKTCSYGGRGWTENKRVYHFV